MSSATKLGAVFLVAFVATFFLLALLFSPADHEDELAALPSLEPTASASPLTVDASPVTDPRPVTRPTPAPRPTPAVPFAKRAEALLQHHLDRWRASRKAPGVAAAVRFSDGSLWASTSGSRAVGPRSGEVDVSTPFAVGSLTKTFVAALVLQLEEEGRLSLGDPISKWLPDYPRADEITVRMLLNHRSGIYNYFEHPAYESEVFGRPSHRWRFSEILELDGRPYCAPGKCYHYSNTNYVLLGRLVNKVTGERLADSIRERFLIPLGLSDTYFQGQERIGRIPAKGYLRTGASYLGLSDGSRFRPNPSAATVANAAGAMVSSVRDISRWQDALFGGEVLSDRSLRLMTNFHWKSGYGLGMREATLAGRDAVGHGGSLRGYMAIMYRLPDEDLDVVLMTNLGRTNLQVLADRLTKAALKVR